MFARIHRGICDREAAVFMVLETVANVDPEVAPVMRKKEQARYSDQSRVVRSLKRHGRLRAGLSVRKASDIIWALATERSYLALVCERGWRAGDYEDWLTEQLAAPSSHGERARRVRRPDDPVAAHRIAERRRGMA